MSMSDKYVLVSVYLVRIEYVFKYIHSISRRFPLFCLNYSIFVNFLWSDYFTHTVESYDGHSNSKPTEDSNDTW